MVSRRRTEGTGVGEPSDLGHPRDTGAEVGETKVVDVQPGETRVVDVQLGESRIADARSERRSRPDGPDRGARPDRQGRPDGEGCPDGAGRPDGRGRQGERNGQDRWGGPVRAEPARGWRKSSTPSEARLRWDAVTVTEDTPPSAGASPSAPVPDRRAPGSESETAAAGYGPAGYGPAVHRTSGQGSAGYGPAVHRTSGQGSAGYGPAVHRTSGQGSAGYGPAVHRTAEYGSAGYGSSVHRTAEYGSTDSGAVHRGLTVRGSSVRAAGTPVDRTPPARSGAADPVKALIHRHRELCEHAVDPLEIAAGLEAHGVTDRTATRFRHRDVFSLAEEMYARVPRAGVPPPPPDTRHARKARADWAVPALLPGALCAAVVTGLRHTEGGPRLAVTAVGVLAVVLGLRAALSRGPLRLPRASSPTPLTRAWTCWLAAYAVLGDGLLTAGIAGGPHGPPTGGAVSPWPIALAPAVALTAACVPAAWCAHLFVVHARRRLVASRALDDFGASARPLLLGVFALHLCALGALLALSGAVLDESPAYAGAGALGALLLLVRLLAVHGFPHAPAVALATAGTTEMASLLSVFAARLPGWEVLATPVETLTDAGGAGAIPALACGAAVLVLLFHATRTLTRASAHAGHGDAW